MPQAVPFDAERALALAARTLDIEAQALAGVKSRLSPSFTQAVQTILASSGRVVVMGMGKSGHVGRKIAATLASTGTPAMFVHPAEASHGDLGMVTAADVVIAISNSGESDELNILLPVFKRAHVPLIAITGKAQSTLAEHADAVLLSTVEQEACPLNLAPPRARPRRWPSAMRWRWRCSTRAASERAISRARIPAARSAASCWSMCAT
jgi:arabinose-5-phosphate isomerase